MNECRLLSNSLNQRLGKGESEAIALGIQLKAGYVLLDDSTARREARKLGLNIKGTLAASCHQKIEQRWQNQH